MNIFSFVSDAINFFYEQHAYIFYILYCLFIGIIIIFAYLLQRKFAKYNTKSGKIKFLQILVSSTFTSVTLFILVQLICDPNNFFLKYLDEFIINIIYKFKGISSIWLGWLGFANFVRQFEKELLDDIFLKKTNDSSVPKTIVKTLKIIAYIIMGIMLFRLFGLSLAKILAIMGGPAAIIIFAGKTAIADLLGGISMLSNKSFSVGEAICIPERGIDGKIMKIGLKRMTLLTIDKKVLTVPNSIISSVSIINKTQSKFGQIYIRLFISQKDYSYITGAIKEIRDMLLQMTFLNKDFGCLVFCNKMSENSALILEIKVYAKTNIIERVEILKQNIFLKTIDIIEKNNCHLWNYS